jgi:hypothetical protein
MSCNLRKIDSTQPRGPCCVPQHANNVAWWHGGAHGVRMGVCHLKKISTHPIKARGERCLLTGQSWHRPLTLAPTGLIGSGEDCTYHSAHINKGILRGVCTMQGYTSACVYHANRKHATHSCNKTTPLVSLCPSRHGGAYARIKHPIPLCMPYSDDHAKLLGPGWHFSPRHAQTATMARPTALVHPALS